MFDMRGVRLGRVGGEVGMRGRKEEEGPKRSDPDC